MGLVDGPDDDPQLLKRSRREFLETTSRGLAAAIAAASAIPLLVSCAGTQRVRPAMWSTDLAVSGLETDGGAQLEARGSKDTHPSVFAVHDPHHAVTYEACSQNVDDAPVGPGHPNLPGPLQGYELLAPDRHHRGARG